MTNTEQKEHTFTCPACKNEVKEIRGSVDNGHLCVECSEAYEKSEQKEQFEGVRAEVSQCSLVTHMGSLNLRREDGKLVANLDMHRDLAEAFAAAWNNQATLKSEMNSLADKIVEMEKENCNFAYNSGLQLGQLVKSKDEEITRLKEENQTLKSLGQAAETVAHKHIAKGQFAEDTFQMQRDEIRSLKEENERLKGVIDGVKSDLNEEQIRHDAGEIGAELALNELIIVKDYEDVLAIDRIIKSGVTEAVKNAYDQNISPISDLQSQLSQAKERIREMVGLLKDLNRYIVQRPKMTYIDDIDEKRQSEYEAAMKRYNDTLEQAQAALKEGECKICNGAGSLIDDFGAPLICECTVAGEPQQ